MLVQLRSGVSIGTLAALCACSGAQSPGPEAPAPDMSDGSEPLAADPASPEEAGPEQAPAIAKSDFGKYEDKAVDLYTMENDNGLVMKVMTYGAIITELQVPDKNGKMGDVVLGFDSLDGYVKGNPYFGATVGRVANRIKNATFKLEGKAYKLAANNAPHHLHGGDKGWDKVVWAAVPKETAEGPSLTLTYTSPDGEEGYPGTVQATAVYTLTNKNELKVEMKATTDKTTLVNMAHHTYWNLGGHTSGPISDHVLTLYADKYTPPAGLVPTGEIKAVKGTPFDFTSPKVIGKDLKAAGGKPIGFDHNWVVNGDAHAMRPVAKLDDPKSGRVMTIEADQPGVQFYSGNFLDGTTKGKGGTVYEQYTGLCLETQKFPNSINVPAWQNEVILKPGETYEHTMIHRFTTQ